MAGVPGKGGQKGRSGAPRKPDDQRRVPVKVWVLPALRDRMAAVDRPAIEAALDAHLPRLSDV